jgi:hypothetical protein
MALETDIAKLMGVMALAWPRYELKPETIKVYSRVLADIQVEALEAASLHIMSTSTFFPSIAEWRQAAFEIMVNKPAIPSQYEAWEMVLREIRRIGSYGQPQFQHQLVARAVEIMGWTELCMSEQIEYDRAHFFKVYASLLDRAFDDVRTLPAVREAMSKNYLPEPTDVTADMAKLAERLRR